MTDTTTREPMTSLIALRRQPRQWWMLGGHVGLVSVLILLVILTSIGSEAFLGASNLINVLRQVSVLAVIATGLTVLMISGGIDFSMGSNAAVTIGLVAQLISTGVSAPIAIGAGLLCASAVGFVNGLVVTFTRVAPFVATLATATLLDGLALLIINGMSVSSGTALYEFGNGGALGIPYLLITATVVCVLAGIMLKHTAFGRHVFAMGGNEDTARLSGIPVLRNKLALYSLTGFLAGLAGVMLLARIGASSPGIGGLALELQAVAAVVIGGTSLAGGKGGILGTVLGVLLLGVLGNALNLLGVSSYFQQMAVGAVLLVAAVANALQSRRR
jgi:ribose transport system permease protein